MMRPLLKLLAAVLLGLGGAPASAAACPVPGAYAPIPADALRRLVDGVVADAMQTQTVSGATVSVVQGGETLLLRGYGMAAVDPARPVDPERTLFRIGSVSKTFTWILLMQLVEEGKVRLDAPVNDYLPPELHMPAQGFTKPIRVIDLMAHTPGLEDIALGQLVAETPAQLMPVEDYLVRHRPDRVREPGQFSTYSNYGVALAGAIVARLRGADFHTVAERQLFEPLGLARTTFREPYPPRAGLPAPMSPALARDVATGFSWAGGRYRPHPFEHVNNTAPAGSISTTAADMARYMKLLLGGGTLDGVRLYGPATAEAFCTPIVKTAEGVNGWAHGFMKMPLPGGYIGFGHGGASQFQLTSMIVVPELDLGIYITANSATGFPLAERLPRHIVREFYAAPVLQRPGVPALAADAGLYAGDYFSTRRPYSGLEKFVLLLQQNATVDVAGGYLLTTAGGAVRAWVPEGPKGRFRAALGEDVLVFASDAEGRATHFDSASGTSRMERTGPLMRPMLMYVLAGLSALIVVWMAPTRLKRLLGKRYAANRARRIDRLALATALLWIGAFALAGTWIATLDETRLLMVFPGPLLLGASITAVAATVATVLLALATPLAWADRPDWPRVHALQQTLAVAVLLLFALVLGMRGFLSPWA